MDFRQTLRNLLFSVALTGSLANLSATAGEAAGAVPAWPAVLDGAACTTANCADTLHASHHLTFVSRLSFPLGSSSLSRAAKGELLRMLVELESFAVVEQVEIIGHADPSGSDKFNQWLSEKRAAEVQDYFAQSGVDPRKVSLRGASSSEPLPGATTPAEQRRVEVRITLRPFY